MLDALRSAKHFIFLEYFIIEEGYMFNTILDILEEKAKAGVDVRFIYDDVGSINSISFGYYKKLQERGIPCVTILTSTPLFAAFERQISISWSMIRYGVKIYTYLFARFMIFK